MGSSTKPEAAEPIEEQSGEQGPAGENAAGIAHPGGTPERSGTRPCVAEDILRSLPGATPAERELTALYLEHRQSLHRCLAARKDIEDGAAEELLQEGFVELWQQSRPAKRVENPAAMLVRIIGNKVTNYLRTRKRRPRPAGDADPDAIAAGGPSPEEVAMSAERVVAVELCLTRMDDDDARIFRLLEVEEKTYAEVAALLGVPIGTVKTRHGSACKAFAVQMSRLRLAAPGDKR